MLKSQWSNVESTSMSKKAVVASESEGIDYSPMLRRAAVASGVGFVVKVATMWRVAVDVHASVHVRTWFAVPYLALTVGRSGFVQITSSSTVVLGFVVVGIVLVAVLRAGDVLHTAGWMFAIFGLFSTLVVDAVLQRIEWPYTDPNRLRWATGSLVLSLILLGLWGVFERPDRVLLRSSPTLLFPRLHPAVISVGVLLLVVAFLQVCATTIFDRPNLLALTAHVYPPNTQALSRI